MTPYSNMYNPPYRQDDRRRPGFGFGGPFSGFGIFPGPGFGRPGFGFGRPGFGFGSPLIGFGVPFLTGVAAGALLTPGYGPGYGPGFGYQPYPPYPYY
ncbi:hypothetical protein BN1058_02814 [Paraliobacillus sp. PM-2]|uniref:hypothetical protein n=1 Tax=Paraliobacillus sp. PM-2 TaxID=1462524 RepID=UPI00061C658B|nr:hypothetical protein [Paraliobacillus sp. PM-2]CQR48445.1 hypothetical protein BN1058_02814 [Paraliobacillus sp. PM-2]